ncbi:hypothetical protein [Amycolatopsis sp. NPDC003861]
MTQPPFQVPEGYRQIHMGGPWALTSCRDCGGNGEYSVSDDTDEAWGPDETQPWSPQPCDCLWSPPPEVLRALDPAHVRLWRHREQMREVFDAIGSRQVGGTYWCRYSRRWYIVESIEIRFRDGDLTHPTWSITARWASDDRGTHHTPWNRRHDSTTPPAPSPGPAPAPPELRYRTAVSCQWCRSPFRLVRAVHRPFCTG